MPHNPGEELAAELITICEKRAAEHDMTPQQVLSALLSGAATFAVFCARRDVSAREASESMGEMMARLYLKVARAHGHG